MPRKIVQNWESYLMDIPPSVYLAPYLCVAEPKLGRY